MNVLLAGMVAATALAQGRPLPDSEEAARRYFAELHRDPAAITSGSIEYVLTTETLR